MEVAGQERKQSALYRGGCAPKQPRRTCPAGVSRLVSAPDWYRRLPRPLQDRLSIRSLRPAGAAWLVPRLEQVQITLGRSVTNVTTSSLGEQLELRLDDGSLRSCDHVLLATGYRVDISAYPFLPASLLERIARSGGFPRLDRGFQSSVPGLHFLGAPSAWSYGPLMRFVAGTEFAAPVLRQSCPAGAVHVPAIVLPPGVRIRADPPGSR